MQIGFQRDLAQQLLQRSSQRELAESNLVSFLHVPSGVHVFSMR